MKRTVLLLLIAVIGIMSLSSCATTLPTRFDSFASSVESNSDNYSLRKWERKNAKFISLCEQYKDNFTLYSGPQRRKINNSIATYVKSAAKSGVVTVTDAVTGLADQISNLMDGAKALFEELGLKKKVDSVINGPAK